MCFSATASFAASAAIFPAGLYAVIKASKGNHHYLPFSFIPIIFSIQQFSEGVIWLALGTQRVVSMHYGSLVYLFVAFLLWPAYFSFSLYFIEPDSLRKKLLAVLTLLGLLLGSVIYIPLLLNGVHFTTTLINNSISYSVDQSAYRSIYYTVCYVMIIFLSTYCCSIKAIKHFGLLLLLSVFITIIWFEYAFTSIWCFFAACLSLYIVYIMYNLSSDKK